MLCGFLAAAFGLNMVAEGLGKVPERSELRKVTGNVEHVTKHFTASKKNPNDEFLYRNIWYEVRIAANSGPSVKLRLTAPDLERVISPGEESKIWLTPAHKYDARVKTLIGSEVVALIKGEASDAPAKPWELSAGTLTLIDYPTFRDGHVQYLAEARLNGSYIAGGGAVLFLLGTVWFIRRRA